jgi:DNA-binding NarL/FixJ family response regulator
MRPNLVVSDIFFSGEPRGIELCRLLEEDLGIPVVLVGESSDPWLTLRIAVAQPVGCVPDPQDAAYLQAVIRRAVKGARFMATAPF